MLAVAGREDLFERPVPGLPAWGAYRGLGQRSTAVVRVAEVVAADGEGGNLGDRQRDAAFGVAGGS